MSKMSKETARYLAELDADVIEAHFDHGEQYTDEDREVFVEDRAREYLNGNRKPGEFA